MAEERRPIGGVRARRTKPKEAEELAALPKAMHRLPIEVRCLHCNRLLMKVARTRQLRGIEIKCPRCERMSWF